MSTEEKGPHSPRVAVHRYGGVHQRRVAQLPHRPRRDELRLDFSPLEQEPPVVRARHEVVVRCLSAGLLDPCRPCHVFFPFCPRFLPRRGIE